MTFCLDTTIIKPEKGKEINNVVVLLHGYGGDGKDISMLTLNWKRHMPNTIFICPNGHETCKINPSGYQWFDLTNDNPDYIQAEVLKAEKIINRFLDEIKEEYNINNDKLILSGFSQGCMMSINIGLTSENPYNCIIGFSGKIINRNELGNKILSRPSTLLIHGDQDEIVPPVNLLEAKDFFERNKIDITTKIIKGCGHNIPVEASSLGLTFLKKIFNINS